MLFGRVKFSITSNTFDSRFFFIARRTLHLTDVLNAPTENLSLLDNFLPPLGLDVHLEHRFFQVKLSQHKLRACEYVYLRIFTKRTSLRLTISPATFFSNTTVNTRVI